MIGKTVCILYKNIHHEWINNSTFIAIINESHAGKSRTQCRAHWSIGSIDTSTGERDCLYASRTRTENRMAHTRPAVHVCVCAQRISYRPSPAPAPPHRRPVAPLLELRRIVTRLDMPASTTARCALAHAHRATAFEHLIIIVQHSWNYRASCPVSSTSFNNLISSITYRLQWSKTL